MVHTVQYKLIIEKILKIFGLLIIVYVICLLVNFYFLNINNTKKSTTNKNEIGCCPVPDIEAWGKQEIIFKGSFH